MSNQNKAQTRDELMKEASEQVSWRVDGKEQVRASSIFIEGAKWADQNPPPEVQGLLDAIERISKNTYGTELCNSKEENNEILADNFFFHQRIAREALETYRKSIGKE